MKKTWKCWLGTVAAAMLGGTAMAQAPDMDFGSEGAVRLGAPSGSATTSYAPGSINTYEPLDADAVWAEAPRAYQGAPPPGDESVGFASSASYNDTQWRVGRVNSNLYGFNGGYTSIGAFIPLSTDGQNMWFFDPRAIITDYGQGAANLGLGYRRYSYAMDRIFGASIWYDYDNGHRTDYSQIGLSLENIGRYFSTRFNANVPLSDSNDFTTAASFGTPFFQGNNIAYLYSFLREMPYQNYVAEAAAPVPFFGRYGWEWAISAYGLVANDSGARDAIGIGGRFEWQVSEDFFINTTITHDRIFSTNASVNFELTIPSGPQQRWLRPKRVHDKLLASVKRPYRVSTSTSGFQETRLFLDPNDGAPIVVAHIDPTAANGAAAGSVTNPFGSVQDYMNLSAADRGNFDIIFVGGNTIATNDNDLNTTIELLDRQRLLGTGALADGGVHQFQALNPGNGQTVFNLPGFANGTSNTGPNPFLTNSGAAGDPVVRINGNYTEVSGFTIDAGGTANGIATVDSALAPRTVDSFAITNNTIQSAVTAINILSDTTPGATGPTTMPPARSLGLNDNVGNISNNTIDGTAGTAPGVTNGIVVNHSAGSGADALQLRVANNDVNDVTGVGIDITASNGAEIDGTASNFGFVGNTVTDSGSGIHAAATGAGSLFSTNVESNTVTGSLDAADPLDPTVGAGMLFLADAGGSMVLDNFINNTLTGNAGNGASFAALAGGSLAIGDGSATVFNTNTFTGNTANGALFTADGAGSTLAVTDVTNSTITGNGQNGLSFVASNAGQMTVGDAVNGLAITGNTITGNTLDGISGASDGAGSLLDILIGSTDTQFNTNTISNNTGNGIDLGATNGGTVQGAVQANLIQDNTLNGVRISAIDAGSTANFNDLANGRLISDNQISGNTLAGVQLLSDNTGFAAGDGVQALFLRNLISGTVANPQEFGIQALGLRAGNLDIDIGDGTVANANSISGNSDANIDVDLAGTSRASVVINGNLIANAINGPSVDFGGDGIALRTTDSSILYDAQILNNVITGNAANGIRLLANTSSQVNPVGDPTTPGLIIQGNDIETNAANGILIQRGGDALVNALIGTTGGVGVDTTVGNIISNNGGHGISVFTEGGATPAGVSTQIVAGQNAIQGNGTAGVGNGVNILTQADSQTRVDLISNVISGAGTGAATQDNGISVTSNNGSYFGTFGGANSTFDGNIISGHTGDGVALQISNVAEIHVDIVGTTQQAQIFSNGGNGVNIIDTSGTAGLGGGVLDVAIGDPASGSATQGADIFPDAPDVVIAQNNNDAIRIAQTGVGSVVLDVSNTLATGNRTTGGVSRNGLSYNAENQTTGGDATINVDNSTFVDFGGDGMHVFYDHNIVDVGFTALSMNVTDSIIGQTQFSTNVGDGVDIEVRDGGAAFVFNNNLIQNNGGDGFRIVTLAEQIDFDRASRVSVPADRDSTNPPDGNDVTTPNNPTLLARADYEQAWGDNDAIGYVTDLTLTNNAIRFNGEDGVDLAIGAATSLGSQLNNAIVRGNDMTGNVRYGFYTRTITNTFAAPPLDSVNNAQGTNDIVRLDPMAHLWLAFGDNASPNTTSQLNATVTGGVFTAADAIKVNANRPILTNFNVFTNNANVTTQAGVPVSTLGRFGQWNASLFTYQDSGGQGFNYTYQINKGTITNTP